MPSMTLPPSVQPNSFASLPSVPQSSVFSMTVPVSASCVPVSGNAVVPAPSMTFTYQQPNALASVPAAAPAANSMGMVCFVPVFWNVCYGS